MDAQNRKRVSLSIVRQGPPLEISYLPGESDTLVISLAGVGKGRIEQPAVEFFQLAHQNRTNHVLFVSDASRSWMNGPGVAASIVNAIESVVAQSAIKRVVALGNSMGGYMALLLPNLTQIDAAIAFVPQFSVKPERIPEEQRWQFFRKRIKQWPFEAIESLPTDQSTVTILHGGTPDELIHANRFPRDPKAKHFILPHMDHRLAHRLHRAGKLQRIVSRAIEGKQWKCRRAIEAAGGIPIDAFEPSSSEKMVAE